MNVADAITPREGSMTAELSGICNDALVNLRKCAFLSGPVVKQTEDVKNYCRIASHEVLNNFDGLNSIPSPMWFVILISWRLDR
jgi:hypothetical protein